MSVVSAMRLGALVCIIEACEVRAHALPLGPTDSFFAPFFRACFQSQYSEQAIRDVLFALALAGVSPVWALLPLSSIFSPPAINLDSTTAAGDLPTTVTHEQNTILRPRGAVHL